LIEKDIGDNDHLYDCFVDWPRLRMARIEGREKTNWRKRLVVVMQGLSTAT